MWIGSIFCTYCPTILNREHRKKVFNPALFSFFSSCPIYADNFRCKSLQKHGWRCRMQEGESARAGNPSVHCHPTKRNVFCLSPGMVSLTNLMPLCPQTWWPEYPLPCPGPPCSSWAMGERWRSPSQVYFPEGPPAPGRAAGRRSEKCSCRDPTGWNCLSGRCQISFSSVWWSWPWPGAWIPRSAECRTKHPAAGPQVQITRRLESYRLKGEKSMQIVRKGELSDWWEMFSRVRQDAVWHSKNEGGCFPRWCCILN